MVSDEEIIRITVELKNNLTKIAQLYTKKVKGGDYDEIAQDEVTDVTKEFISAKYGSEALKITKDSFKLFRFLLEEIGLPEPKAFNKDKIKEKYPNLLDK